MKRLIKMIAIITPVVLVTMLLALGNSWLGGQASAQEDEPTPAATAAVNDRTVSVNGQGRVSVQPDTAVVWFGVQTQADTAVAAMEENNTLMQDVISVTVSSGINEDDIQTRGLNLNPIYSQPPDGNQPGEVTGYQASNIVEVTVRDLESLGELLDTVIAAGGNTIQGINFQVGDNEAALQQAREVAVSNARATAEQLAELTGAELGQVVRISESSFVPLPPVAFDEALAQGGARVAVQPGTEYIEVNVQITWEIE